MTRGKYKKAPRETVTFQCFMCETPKTIPRSEFESKTRETGHRPDTCSTECARAKKKFMLEERRAAGNPGNVRAA